MRIFILAFLSFQSLASTAQLQFRLDYIPDQERYQFSVHSDETYPVPQNMIGTFQATFVAAAGTFDPADMQDGIPGIVFSFNSISRTPASAPAHDYFSVGLTTLATTSIPLVAGDSVVLFTFANAQTCTAPLALIDHATDPFYLDPDKTVNVSNSMVLMHTMSDAYSGNRGDGTAYCEAPTATDRPPGPTAVRIYPNPVRSEAHIQLTLPEPTGAAECLLYDHLGRLARRYPVRLTGGIQRVSLPTEGLPAGSYQVVLQHPRYWARLGPVVKVD